MTKQEIQEECCPRFEPREWQEGSFTWENKKFIRDTVSTFFHVPINFGTVMKRVFSQVQKNSAMIPDNLCLSDHTSKWKMDILLAVDRTIPGVENLTLSGEYMSKVYEGNFKETGAWCQDFEIYVKNNGCRIKKMYMWYTTCPKCAKKYGKNYVVILAEVVK